MGQVKGMRPDAIKAIDAIEPYQGGKGTILWRLHQLNRIDKHRLLITVGSSLRGVGISAVFQQMMEETWSKAFPGKTPMVVPDVFLNPADKLCPLKAGDELFIDQPNAKVNEKIKFAFSIALNEPKIAEAEPLVELLQQMVDFIDNLVPTFAPLLA